MTFSWTSAFAYGYFNLPFLFSFFFVISSLIKNIGLINLKVFKFVLIPFGGTILYYIFSAILNPHIKVLNFTFVYTFVPLLCCYLPLLIKVNKNKVRNLNDYFIYSLLFIALLCIFESIVRFHFGFDITSLVPQLKDNEAIVTFDSGKVLNRSRAFSSEPMIAGISLCIGLQFSLIKFKNSLFSEKKLLKTNSLIYLTYAFIFIFAILTTGSASSFVISLIGIILISFQMIYKFFDYPKVKKLKINVFKIFGCLFFIFLGLILIFEIIPAYKVSLENIFLKISLDKDFTSVRERLRIFNQYFSFFMNDPLGINGSLGLYSRNGSAINWYLTLLGDVGLIGTFFTLLPIAGSILVAINSPFKETCSKFDKLFLILVPSLGLIFHGTFYASPIWATILIAYYL